MDRPGPLREVQLILITEIKVTDRQRTDIGDILALSQSIKQFGLLNPIILEDDLTLRAGCRRLMACSLLGWDVIDARLWGTLTSLEREQIELEENIQRKQLNWQEEIRAKEKIHALMQIQHPQPMPQPNAGPGQPVKAWGLKDTADLLHESIASISQDITLSKAIKQMPELAQQASKTQAFRLLRKQLELAALIEIQSRRALSGTKPQASQVIHADCCLSMPLNLADQTIDLVITDPPWGIDIGASAREWVRMHQQFDDSAKNSIDVTKVALSQSFRVLRDGSHLYLFAAWHLFTYWSEFLTDLGFWVRPIPLFWVKGNVTAGQPYWKFMGKCECIIFAHKGQGGRILNSPASDVLQYDSPKGRIHPTEKPVDLLRYLISLSTVEHEIVLDPFAGSGNTVKAAILMNRIGIGYEIDPEVAKQASANILSIEP